MKTKLGFAVLVIVLLVMPLSVGASTLPDTIGWITGTEAVDFAFTADISPYTYIATLTDLNWSSLTGFEVLALSIATSTTHIADKLVDLDVGYGSIIFDAKPGEKLFASVLGKAGGELGMGKFGLNISAVPIPSALMLLGSGIFALLALKRRNKN